jgi:hypothetical protein
MHDATDKFRGVEVVVFDYHQLTQVYRVVFHPWFCLGQRGPGGDLTQGPRPAEVIVAVDGGAVVRSYYPPERDVPGLTQADYEQKAIREVTGGV